MSRGVLVLGMHRSGTSALTRGLAALSVYLGDNFFDPQPDNPQGYWEDKSLVEISQRVLEELRVKWDDTELIAAERFGHHRVRLAGLAAARYLEGALMPQPIWGFKDPRTLRLFPFWRDVLRKCGTEDAYVLAIRHPLGVAASLFARQEIPLPKAQRMWLVHNVPFLHELAGKPLVVVDYDRLAEAPQAQLDRIARGLDLPAGSATFLDHSLRHNVFSRDEFDTESAAGLLARRAYLALYELATDERRADERFWENWGEIRSELETLLAEEVDGRA